VRPILIQSHYFKANEIEADFNEILSNVVFGIRQCSLSLHVH